MAVVGHCYGLCRAHPYDTVPVTALLGTAFRAGLEATNDKGIWRQNWVLLCIEDPNDRKRINLMSSFERVGMTALHMQKALLEKSREATLKGKKLGS